jgi:tRNA wybutosine-synthesizing protein 1
MSYQEILSKQHYKVSNHSAVQVCRWTKKSLINEGNCYKEQFYGIKSHGCCQMSPCIICQNKCLHCWRPIEESNIQIGKWDKPEEIIEKAILNHKKMLSGFKGNERVDIKKWKESQNPSQFAISLIGEPTLYPYLGEMIGILRKKKISSFVVTNGLTPKILEKLNKKKQLPTQLYLSLNSSNKEDYEKWHRSTEKKAWDKLMKTISIFPELKTRKVIRLTLVRGENMEKVEEYSKLIEKSKTDFVEVKGFMSVGYARKRFGYEKMPDMGEVREFAKRMLNFLPKYKILDEHEFSRVVLIGRNKKDMKIKESEI